MMQWCVLRERAGVAKAQDEEYQKGQRRPVRLGQKERGRAGDEGRELHPTASQLKPMQPDV